MYGLLLAWVGRWNRSGISIRVGWVFFDFTFDAVSPAFLIFDTMPETRSTLPYPAFKRNGSNPYACSPCPAHKPPPHTDRVFLRRPKINLTESACTPLFWNAFDKRNSGCCIHTDSQNAVMATLLWEGDLFEISHQVA